MIDLGTFSDWGDLKKVLEKLDLTPSPKSVKKKTRSTKKPKEIGAKKEQPSITLDVSSYEITRDAQGQPTGVRIIFLDEADISRTNPSS